MIDCSIDTMDEDRYSISVTGSLEDDRERCGKEPVNHEL